MKFSPSPHHWKRCPNWRARTRSRQRLTLPHPHHSSRRDTTVLSRVRLCALL